MITLYHRTSARSAAIILKEGFRDSTGTYLTEQSRTGVWLSDRPLEAQASGSLVLAVVLDMTFDDLADCEWIEEGKGYREWLVPAATINAKCEVRIADDE